MAEPRPRGLRVLAGESAVGPAHAGPRNEDHRENSAEPDLTVVVPDEPPLLTPLAAEALLRLVQHVAAQRDSQIQADEGRAA
jgi:hypothetical protein